MNVADELMAADEGPAPPFVAGRWLSRKGFSPRVLHFSHNDRMGGGPLASFRLHRALLGQGVDSRMLVMRGHQGDPAVETVLPPVLSRLAEAPARILDRLALRLYPARDRNVIWSPGWFSWPGAASREDVRRADVLSLYWINGGFLSIREVGALLSLGKPVVWRLSDLWAFTGGCHHPGRCEGYRRACGGCPQLGSGAEHDLSARLLRAKRHWRTERLVVVSPSRWLAGLARRSAVFGNCRIEHITSGVDMDVFKPRSADEARRRFGLPPDRRLILFGANQGMRNPKKGFSTLIEALERLSASGRADDVDVVVFGQTAKPDLPPPLPIHMMGAISDEGVMAALFSAVDVFATPSLEENLPNTVIEALACGAPAVAFDVGGTGELIEHQVNGWLARPGDSEGFAEGLAFVLEDQRTDERRLGGAARRFVRERHDIRRIAARYADLYAELLGAGARNRAA